MKGKKKAPKAWGPLEKKLGYTFKRKELLREALAHPSSFPEGEKDHGKNYEIMEFFGDSILGFIISEMMYRKHGKLSEGEMSKVRSMIVSAKSLSEVARSLNLGQHIIFGKGEEKTGGRQKLSILAATLEALIAAVYLDGGMTRMKCVMSDLFEKRLSDLIKSRKSLLPARDSKSALQETLHKRSLSLPEYSVVREEGPDHDKHFFVVLKVSGEKVSEGEGKSKKEAEQDAARKALLKLRG